MFNKLSLSEAANFESWARHLVTLGIFFNSSKSSGSKTSTTPYLQKRIVNRLTPFLNYEYYLLISLMTLLTLSKPGLDPQLTSMSSNGTELKTIDVITLQKKQDWKFQSIRASELNQTINLPKIIQFSVVVVDGKMKDTFFILWPFFEWIIWLLFIWYKFNFRLTF